MVVGILYTHNFLCSDKSCYSLLKVFVSLTLYPVYAVFEGVKLLYYWYGIGALSVSHAV